MKIIRKNFYLSLLNLATLRLGGRKFRLRVLSASRSFAHAAQILNYSSTKTTKGAKNFSLNFFFVSFVLSFENWGPRVLVEGNPSVFILRGRA